MIHIIHNLLVEQLWPSLKKRLTEQNFKTMHSLIRIKKPQFCFAVPQTYCKPVRKEQFLYVCKTGERILLPKCLECGGGVISRIFVKMGLFSHLRSISTLQPNAYLRMVCVIQMRRFSFQVTSCMGSTPSRWESTSV